MRDSPIASPSPAPTWDYSDARLLRPDLGIATIVKCPPGPVPCERAWFSTNDLGRTWMKMDVRAVDLDEVSFIDRRRGWALEEVEVERRDMPCVRVQGTRDGGRTWSTLSRVVACRGHHAGDGMRLTFVDARHGWLVKYSMAGFGAWLHRTVDGWPTWQEAGELPTPAVVAFKDPGRGLLGGLDTHLAPSGRFSTGDGGRTWTSDPHLPFGGPLSFGLPVFFGDRAVQPIFVGETILDVEPVVGHTLLAFYSSFDGGRKWSLSSHLANLPYGTDFNQIAVAGPETWWVLADGRSLVVHRTTNAGRSWSTIGPVGLPEKGTVVSFTAPDEQTAWVTIAISNKTRRMLATHDGGMTAPFRPSPVPR